MGLNMELKITNSLTRKKEIFTPIEKNKVRLYVCGITPYDYSHIGHGRSYVNFDLLFRFLKFLDYEVTYIRNFTDIDDKILAKAEKKGDIKNYMPIVEKFIKAYHTDMAKLNCQPPTKEPRVTQSIPQIIKFIQGLIDKDFAYVVNSDVYFETSKFAEYGKLSGKKLDDLQAGARVEISDKKRNPADFALWKGNEENLFWKSPWGYGRPGWHIECSVMAKEFLGETIDIHGGGIDLIFPHHENEIAQSEGLHSQPFSRYWMHNAFVNINKEKMSKSLGNFFTLDEIFEKINPMELRFYFLEHQYKTPLEFNFESIQAAQTTYKKLVKFFENIEDASFCLSDLEQRDDFTKEILNALCDDLNTPKALGIIFENLDQIKKSKESAQVTKFLLTNIFGLTLESIEEKKVEITPEIEKLLEERKEARKQKNWYLADQIRDKLIEMGVEIKDKKIN